MSGFVSRSAHHLVRSRSAVSLLTLGAAAVTVTCGEATPTESQRNLTTVVAPPVAVAAAIEGAADSPSTLGTIPLPISQTFNGPGPVFRILHEGTGTNALFINENKANTFPAVFGLANGAGDAVRGTSTGSGRAGFFSITNATNPNPALEVASAGAGGAARFTVNNPFHNGAAVVISTNSFSGGALRALSADNAGAATAYFENSASDNQISRALEAYVPFTGAAGVFRIDGGPFNLRGAIEATSNADGPAGIFRVLRPSTAAGIDVSTVGAAPAGMFTVTNPNNVFGAIRVITNTNIGWAGLFTTTGAGGGVQITTSGGPGLQVIGGTKNAVVNTSSGTRALYTEESAEVWFTDYAFGRLTRGRAHIDIDPMFAETVNLSEPYHVFVQSYGDAELIVTNRTATGFDVVLREGKARDAEFSYRLVAKRLGFEKERLRPARLADRH